MKNKKKIITIVAALLLMVGAYQVTMANFNQNGTVNTKISAGKLGIEIVDLNNNANVTDNGEYEFSSAMPGSVMIRQTNIQNTKDKDLYVRVTLTRYWKDANNKKVTEADANFINILTNSAEKWIISEDAGANSEIITFYYKQPVAPGESTTPFMDAIQLSETIEDQIYSKYHASIKVEAEAIQKAGAQEAMLSEWGIEAEFDNQGNILSIVE